MLGGRAEGGMDDKGVEDSNAVWRASAAIGVVDGEEVRMGGEVGSKGKEAI